MRHIVKNVIPYWKSVLIIFVLLVVQAFCELALPTYTSNLIDVGIQNSGIEHILPVRITKEEYQQATILMTEEEKEDWNRIYREDYTSYELLEKNEDKLSELDEEFLTSIVLNYQLGHMEEDAFKETIISAMAANEQTSVFAQKIPDMSLEELQQSLQVVSQNDDLELSTFEGEDEDGNKVTYVDMRPLLSTMINSGVMTDEMISQSRSTMEDSIESIGSSSLKSMGIQYAVSCDEAAGENVDDIQMSYLFNIGGKMLVIALIMMAAAIAVSYFASRVGAGVGRDLRKKVFGKVIVYSNAEIDKFSSASLITRATNDVQQVQMVTTLMLRMILYAPILGAGGIIKVAGSGANMSWIIVLGVVLILTFVGTLVSISMPKFKIMQTMVDRLNLVSREILTGLSVIRAFGRESTEEERFDKANRELKSTQLFTNRVMAFMMPGMMLIMNCIVVLIVWVSAKHIDAGNLQVGAMTAFITYTMVIVMAFLMLTAMSIMLPRAGVAADRINEVLTTETSILEPENPQEIKNPAGVLEFKNVSFKYPGAEENVIENISFKAEPGKVTAIIGSTGSGKSTLVNLIPRAYDVTEGQILLDGVDIRNITMENLRDNIGFVPQKGVLFSGTIASNLRFGREAATDEEIKEAAAIAQVTEFIEDKRDGIEAYIAQGGRNVSGGQKQRLAIARAIAKNPKIFVFDDSFSALDMKTDADLRAALSEKVADSTEIIVAQRISTIIHADQILVLDEGKIVGCGTHEELLKNCDVYMQIATSQLSLKELGLDKEVSDNE